MCSRRGVDRRTGGKLATPTRDGDLPALRLRPPLDGRAGDAREPAPTRSARVIEPKRSRWFGGGARGGSELELGFTVTPVVGGRASAESGAGQWQRAGGGRRGVDRRLRAHQHRQRALRRVDRRLGARSARLMMPVGDSELPAGGIPLVRGAVRSRLTLSSASLDDHPDVAAATLRCSPAFRQTPTRSGRRRAGQDLPRAARRELARTGQIPPHPTTHRGCDAAVPDGRRRLLPAGRSTSTRCGGCGRQWTPRWRDRRVGDRDGDGFVEYERRSPAGLRNAGLRRTPTDSIDARADGNAPRRPIDARRGAGYVYEAKAADRGRLRGRSVKRRSPAD